MKTTKSILTLLLLLVFNISYANTTTDPATAAQYRKAIAMRNQGKVAESIPVFDEVIAKDPKMLYVYFERGFAKQQLGKLLDAIDDYTLDNSQNPNHSSYNLACAYSILGKKAEAIKFLKMAQSSLYNQPAYWLLEDTDLENIRKESDFLNLAGNDNESDYQKLINEGNQAFYQEINFTKAAEAFDKAVKLDPNNPIGYRARANSNLMGNKHETVLADLDKALSLNDITGAYYCNVLKGKIYQVKKDYSKACEMYDLAKSQNPQWAGELDVCYAHFMNGNKARAYEIAKEMADNNEKDIDMNTAAGIFANNMNEYDIAIVYSKKALQVIQAETNKDYIKESDAQGVIGDAYNYKKDYERATRWYRDAEHPKKPETAFKAGVAILNWLGTMPSNGADGATKADWKYRACHHLEVAKRDGYVDTMNTYQNFCGK
jgi:tetratricopeptide (TPR) repeat protein